ncbi:MAG: hypothetical protein KF760_03035 [Candidatus Eremiobacteraeota bacterium]|nr:hypothetical protein [Candidatus Eremiobacteraeota bacterium]MCW5871819.1 hypothetical protein [Candidatus Eremiobacteraeota bacterium]
MLSEPFCNFEGCASPVDVQQRLREAGLSASPRLATRLLALQQRLVRLTWSALEVLLAEGQSQLMRPEWLQQPFPLELLTTELEPAGLVLRQRRGLLEVLSSDEVWLESQETALVPLASEAVAQAMVRPSRPGVVDEWPDSWRIVADAEETARILEHLRSAFRQLRSQGGSPAPLLWLALKRKRPEVTREVARLTHEYLDADAGRQLENLFSPVGHVAASALKQLRQNLAHWDPAFLVGLLQILWDQNELRQPILEVVEDLTGRWQEQPDLILAWWEDCLAQAASLEPLLVQRLAQITLHWARLGLDLVPSLLRRLQKGLALAERMLASWLLGQLDLQGEERQLLLEQAWALAAEPGLGGQSLVRVEQILTNLGYEAIAPLLDEQRFGRLQPDLRCWLVGEAMNWPDLKRVAELRALQELGTGSRRMLRQLSELGWKLEFAVEDELRWTLASFLEQEIPHLEDPDDAWAIALLVQLDPDILLRQFLQARRDAELHSRAFPVRLETLAKHCAASDRPPTPERLEFLLEASYGNSERPEMWRSWAIFLSCPSFPEELRSLVIDHLEKGKQAFPQLWPEWWEQIQRSPDRRISGAAELDIQGVLTDDTAGRGTVQAVLETLGRRVGSWYQAQDLVKALSRRLLFLPVERSPQQRLRWALAEDSQGDGVFLAQSWDAEQRDLALGLLGQLAQRPDLSDELRRPLRVRCWQFLRDWLDGVARGGDSYQHRSMPLWTTARQLLPQISAAESELVDDLSESVIGLQGSCPERLRLLTHGDCLGFLLDWAMAASEQQAIVRQRQLLVLLQQLLATSDRDYRPVVVGYLVGLPTERLHPGMQAEWLRLRQRWEGWLYGE